MAHINLRDHEADGSERSDLSIICDSSLNSCVRMSLAPEDDPAVAEIIAKASDISFFKPPEDKSIKTLDVRGLNSRIILEQDIQDKFGAYGEIESIRILAEECRAFVTYTTREGAEKAAQELTDWLVINGQRLKLGWAVSLSQQQMDLQRMGALMSIRRLVFSGTSESNGASSSYQIPPHQPYPYAYNYKPTYW